MLQVVQSGSQPEQAPTFDDFWLLFPRRVARKDAVRAWSRLSDAERVAAVVGLVAWRRVWLARNDLDYVPYPASWLNGERWTDELPPSAAHASHVAAKPPEAGARSVMPDHVRAAIARLRAK